MTSFKPIFLSAALLAPAFGCLPLDQNDPALAQSAITGTATRPLLTSTEAANFTVLKYLAQAGSVTSPTVDNWNPTAGVGSVSSFTPTYTVAASGGTHTSVQAAINAASGSNRVYIRVMAGTYREVVCVKPTAPPITLYSTSSDASQTVIVFNNYAGKAKAETAAANPCDPNINPNPSVSNVTYQTYGTKGSATFLAFANGFQAKNLTFSNDIVESSVSASAVQAVALSTQADKLVFENVRLLGNQDTLLAKTVNVATISRVYFKASYIEGDVDFICGRATMVFDGGQINFTTSRRTTGNIVAPSTDSRNPFGILISGASFTATSGTASKAVTLGRAWDEGQVDLKTYAANIKTGIFPNGQALVRDSVVRSHINTAPWAAAATTSRKFSSTSWSDSNGTYPANKLYEYNNTAN